MCLSNKLQVWFIDIKIQGMCVLTLGIHLTILGARR